MAWQSSWCPGRSFSNASAELAPARPIRASRSVIRPSDDALAAAVVALTASKATTILAGAGCQDAHDEVVALAGVLQAPVVHAMRGKEFLEYDNPFDVGMTGLLGFSSGYRAMEHCDTLLILGSDFPYRDFYPDDVTVIQVDVRGEQIGRRVDVDIPLVGNVKDTVVELLKRLDLSARLRPSRPHDGALQARTQAPRRACPGEERSGSVAPSVRHRSARPPGRR